MRASTSLSPQLAIPLMPHIFGLFPRFQLQFVNLRFDVKKLDTLKNAVDQSRNAIKESHAENVLIEKERERGTWQGEELAAEPAAALRLRSRQRRCQFVDPCLAV